MRIQVFHNIDPLAPAFGYKRGASVCEVYVYDDHTSTSTGGALAEAFRLLNLDCDSEFGEPDPRTVTYRDQGHRSLSVGDVIGVDGSYYACAAHGWAAISTPRIVPRAAPPTSGCSSGCQGVSRTPSAWTDARTEIEEGQP